MIGCWKNNNASYLPYKLIINNNLFVSQLRFTLVRSFCGVIYCHIIGRMLEANGRGFWNADEDKLDKLRELYELTDDELEGITV